MQLWRKPIVRALRTTFRPLCVSESSDQNTNKLRNHIYSLVLASLEGWKPTCSELRASASAALTDQIVAECYASHPTGAAQRSAMISMGKALASYLSLHPGNLEDVLSLSATHYIQLQAATISDSKLTFTSIQHHHQTIRKQPWEEVTSNTDALQVYADAACSMGQRRWLQDSNAWLLSFASKYFAAASSRPLRILDIGSCYNPLLKCADYDPLIHDITAVDLHPAHSSVRRCDFLSVPILDISSPHIANNDIEALPRSFYDAVCMSVVLSYVPYPEQRAAMIAKAREVTRSTDTPGLLLLVEKKSIFSAKQLIDSEVDAAVENSKTLKSRVVDLWISSICSAGYECIASFQNTKRHLMAFRVTNDKSTSPAPLYISTYEDERDRIRAAIYRIRESQLPVCIAGAGIGGSALAAALQQRNVPYILLEKDYSFSCRKQGYALTLQQAISPVRRILQKCHLAGSVSSYTHVSFDSRGRVLGVYGPPLQDSKIASKQNTHISRQQLRQLFMDKVDTRNIRWDSSVESYCDSSEGVVVKCKSGSYYEASCLVAADGIHSRIRQIKHPHHSLRYLNLLVILGITENDFDFSNHLSYRKAQWVDGTTRVFTMPYDVSHTMWQLSFPCDETLATALARDSVALHRVALEKTQGWHTPLVRLLQSTDLSRISGHGVYDRDVPDIDDLRGDVTSLVTFIGDAWHPMSPFKGQGANQAIIDADTLASYLQKYYTGRSLSLCQMLTMYEAKMTQGAINKVLKSRSAAEFLHSERALAPGNITRAAAAELLRNA